MKIGYSFWGFLGDIKMDVNRRLASTPDGNATYSWSIISKLQELGNDVVLMMPDRDKPAVEAVGTNILFKSFAKVKRISAYCNSIKTLNIENAYRMSEEEVHECWDNAGCKDLDIVLHEWRMSIEGRNTRSSMTTLGSEWQPDLFIQECLIDYCKKNNLKLVVFDLDYKLEESDVNKLIEDGIDLTVFELGNKWKSKEWAKKVYIPFDFSSMYELKPNHWVDNKLVYVGNRYERDWCIDKYIPQNVDGVVVYGNWNEGGRDSSSRWQGIQFRNRIQVCDMYEAYSKSATTILLAKEDYCKYGFMTARVFESLLFCSVPMFIEEYGSELIEQFVGDYSRMLTVHSVEDVIKLSNKMYDNAVTRCYIINELRERISKFMDVKLFVEELLSC